MIRTLPAFLSLFSATPETPIAGAPLAEYDRATGFPLDRSGEPCAGSYCWGVLPWKRDAFGCVLHDKPPFTHSQCVAFLKEIARDNTEATRRDLIARIWNAGILLLGNPGQTPEAIEIPRVLYRETPNGIFCTSYRMRNWKYDMQGRMVVSSVQVYFIDAQGFTTPADDWETRFLPGIAETIEGAVETMIRANLG